MDIQILSLALNALQTVAIVISLAALIYQLRQFSQSLQQDAYTKLAEYSMKISELLLQDQQLANAVYQCNTDYLKLNNTQKALYGYIGLILGLYERLYLLFKIKGIDHKNWKSWDKWLVEANFPLDLFEVFWKNENTSYHEDFCKYVDKSYKMYKLQVAQSHAPA
jgi:hypothetical protein